MGVERSWQSTTIGILFKNNNGNIKTGPFGTTLKAKEYSNEGVPLISVGEIQYGSLKIHDSTPKIPLEVINRLPEYVLKEGDIVFGRKGAVDRSAYVKKDQAGWFLGSDGIRLRPPKSCNARFLAYHFQSPLTKAWLNQHATGTTMLSLNQDILERVPIQLPPLPMQRAIAHILGTLDDKIELNRRMNETLEAMAQALFKSWFVDFDPVRAKAEGRDTGLPKEIADLFPDGFEESELGEIPRGWRVSKIFEIAEVIYGAPFSSQKFNKTKSGYPLIRIRDLPSESPEIWTSESHPKGYLVRPGDILVGMDGEFRAYLWGGEEGWLNQRVCVFLPKNYFSKVFVRESIIPLLFNVETTETATTVIHLGKNDIDKFLIVTPSKQLVQTFNNIPKNRN